MHLTTPCQTHNQSHPELANTTYRTKNEPPCPHPGRAKLLALISTLAWIKGVKRQGPTIVQTLLLSWRRAPGCRLVAPLLQISLEHRQVLVHPPLVQPDGFQSFPSAPHLRTALLQTREESLHLNNTHRHTLSCTYLPIKSDLKYKMA